MPSGTDPAEPSQPASARHDRWAHQPVAVDAITAELGPGGRALMIAACGSGKSTISALAARRLAAGGVVLVVVPSLDLAGQMLRTFHRLGGAGRLVAVCSDQEILQAPGTAIEGIVTTRPEQIAAALAGPGRVTAVCTYPSLPMIAAAHARHGLGPHELVVIDEAHRSAGRAERTWALVHDDVAVPARRRLYMTATPKIVTGGPDGEREVVSMNDEKVYGPVVYELRTGEAIRRGLLADWRLLVPVVAPHLLTCGQPIQVGRTGLDPAVLAQQMAVLRAARDHDIRALITYHHLVSSARTWATTLPQTWQLMPADLRPTSVTARHVDGEQDPQVRRTILTRLGTPDPDGGLYVVPNVRVLSEGVDVPAIDAIAMIDPRSSLIDIVQMIGRAMRNGDDPDKIAKIIVPLLLSPGENPAAALSGSAWRPLWRVLSALRAHDDRLDADLTAAQIRFGEASQDGTQAGLRFTPPWLHIDGGMPLPEHFATQVWVRAVRVTAPIWQEYYGAARAYHREHGHVRMEHRYQTPGGLSLGKWLAAQLRRWDQLTGDQQSLLDELGARDNLIDLNWNRGLAAARAWLALHPSGLHTIPADWTHDGLRLNDWIGRRRMAARTGLLGADRHAQLCALDPDWYLTRPQRYLRAARAFTREHGHLLPDPDYRSATGLDLPAWLHDVRNRRANDNLNPEISAALDRLGMVWGRRDAQLKRGLIAARRHFRTHRTLTVPADHLCKDGYALGAFLKQARTSRREGTLRPWCAAALDAIDPSWYGIRTKAERIESRLTAVAAYLAQHGHLPHGKRCNKPDRTSRGLCPPPPAPDFRQWLADQRVRARKGTLSPDIQARLDALDPHWCPPLPTPAAAGGTG